MAHLQILAKSPNRLDLGVFTCFWGTRRVQIHWTPRTSQPQHQHLFPTPPPMGSPRGPEENPWSCEHPLFGLQPFPPACSPDKEGRLAPKSPPPQGYQLPFPPPPPGPQNLNRSLAPPPFEAVAHVSPTGLGLAEGGGITGQARLDPERASPGGRTESVSKPLLGVWLPVFGTGFWNKMQLQSIWLLGTSNPPFSADFERI